MPTLPDAITEAATRTQALIAILREAKPDRTSTDEQVEGLYALGHDALANRRHGQAQAVFTCLVTQCPAESRFVAGLAPASVGLGDLSAGESMHAIAVALDPHNPGLQLAWAEALIALGRQQQARFVLRLVQAATRRDSNLTRLNGRASALLELLDHAS